MLLVQMAEQLVASVETQLSVAVCPESIVADTGDTERVTVGAGAGVPPPSLITVVCALATCSCFRLCAS